MARMSELRKKADWPIVVGVALVVFSAVGAYAVGYVTRPQVTYDNDLVVVRYYNSRLEAAFFWPAARVDSLLTARDASTSGRFKFGVSPDDA